jgi:tRNA uridine 5-carboxymethylaminomethyl modification enzyme
LHDLLKRPEIKYTDLVKLPKVGDYLVNEVEQEQVEVQIKYAGYIKRQHEEVGKQAYLDDIKLPSNVDYTKISGLSSEVIQKLNKFKPENLGQASRISGITPAAISLLQVYSKKGYPLIKGGE